MVATEHFVCIPNVYTVSQGFEIHASRKQIPTTHTLKPGNEANTPSASLIIDSLICTAITTLLVATSLVPCLHVTPCERMGSGDETKHKE